MADSVVVDSAVGCGAASAGELAAPFPSALTVAGPKNACGGGGIAGGDAAPPAVPVSAPGNDASGGGGDAEEGPGVGKGAPGRGAAAGGGDPIARGVGSAAGGTTESICPGGQPAKPAG